MPATRILGPPQRGRTNPSTSPKRRALHVPLFPHKNAYLEHSASESSSSVLPTILPIRMRPLPMHALLNSPGDLTLDKTTIAELRATSRFTTMSIDTDEAEHSLEMHLPYIHKMLSRTFSPDSTPPLVPILVGSTSPAVEKEYGAILAPYLADPTNIFVVSSDFCHWGLRFGYTYYLPRSDPSSGYSLGRKSTPSSSTPIHESIGTLDHLSMRAVESGSHDAFLANLRETGNTVCGRHPIGVVMSAMEVLKAQKQGIEEETKRQFRFVRYERSSECVKVGDSSVSYASAFAVI